MEIQVKKRGRGYNLYSSRGSRKLRQIIPFLSKARRALHKISYPNWRDIPVIINNFNRLTFLKRQIDCLTIAGIKNIYIIDNNSTYKPLLDFYQKTPYKVFYLNQNIGHLALWETDIFFRFIHDYYVYTDPDVVPMEGCKLDYMEFFLETLMENTEIEKIGFSLFIDDIPDSYPHKNAVLEIEKPYWEKRINNGFFQAPIDTTFALYRPYSYGGWEVRSWRTDLPYCARHLPWYVDFDNLSEEEQFYISNAKRNVTTWSKL